MNPASLRKVRVDPSTLRRLLFIRQGAGAVAHIELVIDGEGRRAVLKSFCHRGQLFRRTVGAYMARREVAAYRRLGRLEGIPRLYGVVGCDGILLEHVDCDVPDRHAGGPPPEFFRQLSSLLERVRALGVLHGDVCRNVRIDRSGRPLLMDFGSSFVIRPWLGPLRSVFLSGGERHDEHAVAVLRKRTVPESLTAADLEVLAAALPWYRTLEAIRRMVEMVVTTVLDRSPGAPP